MSIISPEYLNRHLDNATKTYLRKLAVTGQSYGDGEPGDAWGAAVPLAAMLTDLGNDTDAQVAKDLYGSISTAKTDNGALDRSAALFTALVSALSRNANTNQPTTAVVDLDTMLTYYNTTHATKWQMLQHPSWRTLYTEIKGAAPARQNLYFDVIQGATYTNALAKYVMTGAGTGTLTDGYDIDTSQPLTCGGIPVINWASGWAGVSATVTVTCDAYNPATLAVQTAVTMTFTVTGNGRFFRVAGTAATNALIVDVVSIAVGAGITAGTMYVEAERPTVHSGTSTAGAATTITLATTASRIDEHYTGLQIGTVADVYTPYQTITAYDGRTRIATVASWGTNPSTSAYRILRPTLP